ncbi:hypothetical protein LZ30DRAFT_203178 [Colletotrichum cereale]|nr:hypothetical protein LZ30DRAFT_203178 [Colletotrichum cereale]
MQRLTLTFCCWNASCKRYDCNQRRRETRGPGYSKEFVAWSGSRRDTRHGVEFFVISSPALLVPATLLFESTTSWPGCSIYTILEVGADECRLANRPGRHRGSILHQGRNAKSRINEKWRDTKVHIAPCRTRLGTNGIESTGPPSAGRTSMQGGPGGM